MKTMKMSNPVRRYVDAATNRNSGDVELWYRDRNGRKVREVIEDYCNERWYFYITIEDYQRLDSVDGCIDALENAEMPKLKLSAPIRFEIEDNNKWVKVFVRNGNINEKYAGDKKDDRLRLKKFLENEAIKIYEGDIHPHKRYCIDNNIQISNKFKILYYDIETDDSNPGIVVGRDNILSIGGYDQDGKEYFWYKKHDAIDDEDFLEEFLEDVKYDFDVLVGWNSDQFDKLYILNRLKEHEINHWPFIKNIAHIDLMQIFIKRFSNNSELTRWSLEFIAQYFLDEGKVEDVGKGNSQILNLYNNDFPKFKKYNLKDAWLLYELNRKLGVVEQILLECQICGCFPSKFSVSELLDTYILRSVKGLDIHFPSIEYGNKQARCPNCNYNHSFSTEELPPSHHCKFCKQDFIPDNKEDDIAGGYVVDPVTGRHDDVFTFDYRNLYPAIIQTWNIGPDSFVEGEELEAIFNHDQQDECLIKSANGQYFNKNESSTIKNVIDKLLTLRREFKAEMLKHPPGSREYEIYNAKQRATKLLCNSLYGIMAFPRGRYYKKEIAEAITLGGQWLNKETKKWFEEKGYQVIYGDTDSVFVKMPKEDRVKIPEMLDELKVFYDKILKEHFNIDSHTIDLEYEKHYRRLILVQKKRYAGHIIEQDGEKHDKILVKGLEYVKRDTIPLAKKWQKELLDSLINEDKPQQDYVKWVEGKQEIFFNETFDLSDITITKKLTKNPKSYKTKAVHVTIAEELKKREMEYYVGMRVPYIVTAEKPLVASHPEWYEPGTASTTYYWDKQVYSICERILQAVFKDYDWAQYTTKIVARRQKKVDQYKKWLDDPKRAKGKRREKDIIKIQECKIISNNQREELLAIVKPKKFKMLSLEDQKKRKVKIKAVDISSDQEKQNEKVINKEKTKLRLKPIQRPIGREHRKLRLKNERRGSQDINSRT